LYATPGGRASSSAARASSAVSAMSERPFTVLMALAMVSSSTLNASPNTPYVTDLDLFRSVSVSKSGNVAGSDLTGRPDSAALPNVRVAPHNHRAEREVGLHCR
jgi:hypothetical protein